METTMRLTTDQAHIHLENIMTGIEGIQERCEEMLREALGNHRHPATFNDPAWFDSKGQALLDAAEEATVLAERVEQFHERVYDFTEDGGHPTVRSIRWAYRLLARCERLV